MARYNFLPCPIYQHDHIIPIDLDAQLMQLMHGRTLKLKTA